MIRTLPLLSCVLTSVLFASAAAAQPNPAQDLFDAKFAADAAMRCSWLERAERLALAAEVQERLAFITLVGHDSIATRLDREVAAEISQKPLPCDGADVDSPTGPKASVRGFAQAITATWSIRARSVLTAMKAQPFAADLVPLEPHRAAIETAASNATARVRGIDPAQLNAEAGELILAACARRKDVRSPSGPRACPALPATASAGAAQYADDVLTLVERFAGVLTESYEEAARTTNVLRLASVTEIGGLFNTCLPGSLVIRNPENGTKDLALYRLGEWEPVGRVNISSMGGGEYGLLSADADATRAGASGLVTFKRCF